MLVSIWGGSVPAQLCLPLTRAGTSSPAVLQGGGKRPGWQKQQRGELHIPVGALVWTPSGFPCCHKHPRQDPLDTPAKGEAKAWDGR